MARPPVNATARSGRGLPRISNDMRTHRNFLLAALALIGAITATSEAALAQAPFDECGVISDNFGSGCTTFVDNATGQHWLPDVSLSGFNVGDTVRITGTTDPGCFHFCFVLAACITGANVTSCAPPDPGTPYCFGDGGDGMGCTDCPCGNNAPSGSGGGCLNSQMTSAVLSSSGVADVSNDTLHFDLAEANVSTFAVLTSADNQLPQMGACPVGSGIQSPVLDGLRCVGGTARRHGARATDAQGDTTNGWGPPAGPAGGLIAQYGFVAGQTRNFQCFYRELPSQVCMTGQNTSNAVAVTFGS